MYIVSNRETHAKSNMRASKSHDHFHRNHVFNSKYVILVRTNITIHNNT